MDGFVKGNEKQIKANTKPRNIFNPCIAVKSVCGYVMWVLLTLIKKTPTVGGSFCCGLSPEQVRDRMNRQYKLMKKPKILLYDGHQHDAHQHANFMEDCDHYLLRQVVPVLGRLLGFTAFMIKLIINNLTILFTRVVYRGKDKRYPRKSKMLIRLIAWIRGTVYSGHPSKTTFGNTWRIICLLWRITVKTGFVWNVEVFVFQAGDDTYILIEDYAVDPFLDELQKVYSSEGYGLVAKDLRVLDNGGDFLSRDVLFSQGCHFTRKAVRVVQSGLISDKLSQKDMDSLDGAITSQLSWGSQMVGMREFLRWRAKSDGVPNERVRRYLANEYNFMKEGVETAFPDDNPNIALDYKLLDACGGDPTFLWVKSCA